MCRDKMSKDTYFVKLGGSVITDIGNEGIARNDEIKRLLSEVMAAKSDKGFNLILGHGSGSFAHVPASRYKTKEGLVDDSSLLGASITELAATNLTKIIFSIGTGIGAPLFPFSPASFSMGNDGALYSGFTANIEHAMQKGFIPLVYGDVVIDKRRGCTIASTEEVFRFLSTKIKPSMVVLGTDVDGVFDSNPKDNKAAKLIPKINAQNYGSVMAGSGASKKIDVTGGMGTKLSKLYEITKRTSSEGCILNASLPGVLGAVLHGNHDVKCTRILP